ncbi:MAG: threonine ammonia-lyase [Spirochaetales bacterium]|nr:threonine ammonia-lyase [Spirochaetales bacterium]
MTLDKVYQAHFVLKEVARKTDLIRAPKMFEGADVYLKTENLQNTGSFKLRGAYFKMARLSDEEKKRGVVACSAGNHAQGVALAAQKQGIDAIICVPEGAPISKVEATRSYGAKVELVKGVYDDAYNRAVEIAETTGRVMIHPFNDEDVIAGQGTIGLEILEQLPEVEAVIVPVGGGGLISGLAFTIKTMKPSVKIYGVQSAGAPSMRDSIEHHRIERLPRVATIADGIAVKEPGELTYNFTNQYVDQVVTVTDDEVAVAILELMERQKLVSEGAGAVAVAAAMFGKVDIKDKKTVCLVSGGNIDVTILSRVINRALMKEGRIADITVELMDKPGQLVEVSSIVAKCGANVIGCFHDKTGKETDINGCTLRISMETRNHEHVREIKKKLLDAGFKFVGEDA